MDYNRSKESADYINQRTSIRPQLGIICGSGWGKTFGSKISTEVHIVNMTWIKMVGPFVIWLHSKYSYLSNKRAASIIDLWDIAQKNSTIATEEI
jgi:hypothetical protein